jgi:hypothetical protein
MLPDRTVGILNAHYHNILSKECGLFSRKHFGADGFLWWCEVENANFLALARLNFLLAGELVSWRGFVRQHIRIRLLIAIRKSEAKSKNPTGLLLSTSISEFQVHF